MIVEIIAIVIGFIVLLKSADMFVDGVVVFAKKIHVEEVVIGITLVALGTSLPELFVNLSASQRDLDDALVGNVLGSCLFNLLLILGIQLSICPLTKLSRRLIRFDLPMALIFVLLTWIFFLTPISNVEGLGILPWEGYVLSALYIFFILKKYFDFRSRKNVRAETMVSEDKEEVIVETSPHGKWSEKYYYIYILIGMVGLYFGSDITVGYSVELARILNLSEAFIGVFILSVGTSLPELITTLVAIRKNYGQLALGNILGSNICNIGLVLAIFAWTEPIHYNPQFHLALTILVGVTAYLLIALSLKKKKQLNRIEGIVMIVGYLIYAGYSYFQGL